MLPASFANPPLFRETEGQQCVRRGLFGLETFHAPPKLALGFRSKLKYVDVTVQHFGMHENIWADRRRVAEPSSGFRQ